MASEFEPLLPRAGHRLATGGWKSAMFIIWVGVAERFAYYGISANLISYLTGPLGQSTANAAAAVNVWSGAASMLPVLGAVVADSWLGQYRTIVFSSVLYITFIFQMVHTIGVLPLIGINASGLCRFVDASESTQMNALSSMFPSPEGQQCNVSADGRQACPPSSLQTAFFYVSLYMVAIALSGHKPCLQAFGADQFDATDPKESLWQNSFFNWWYFGICGSATVTTAVMSYVQDNVSWGVGFGLPCVAMMLSLVVFLLGTSTYRLYDSRDGGGAAKLFSHAGQTLRAWMKRPPAEAEALVEHGDVPAENTVIVEELKSMARLFPIWATCLLYGVVYAQPSTLFTKQAATLDRRVDPSSSFQVPAAAMQCFKTISTITCVVLYDRVLVPAARRVSGVASGITMLQRIGAGMALAVITLVVAALVEMKRLSAATDAAGALAVVPMSVWWMVPQYVLLGMADAFTMVGMQEFFYDQMPSAFKSLGLGLYLSVLGVGSFISSFLISVIDGVTRRNGGTSWFADNLDRGHLDYFYLLVAALAALELLAFLYFSTSYVYKRKTVNVH